jgi:hypothetical protein
MSGHTAARTTVRLDGKLLEEAQTRAQKENTTLTALIDRGLRLVLRTPARTRRKRIVLPVSKEGGGTLAGIDLNKTSELLDRIEFDDSPRR